MVDFKKLLEDKRNGIVRESLYRAKVAFVGGWGFLNLDTEWDSLYKLIYDEIKSYGDQKVDLIFDQSSYSFHFLHKFGERLKNSFPDMKYYLYKFEDNTYLFPFIDNEMLPIFAQASVKGLLKGAFSHMVKFPKYEFFNDLLNMDSLFDEVIEVDKETWYSDVFCYNETCSLFTKIIKDADFTILFNTLSSQYRSVWESSVFYLSNSDRWSRAATINLTICRSERHGIELSYSFNK